MIIELRLWPDQNRQINHLPAGRSFGEGQGVSGALFYTELPVSAVPAGARRRRAHAEPLTTPSWMSLRMPHFFPDEGQ